MKKVTKLVLLGTTISGIMLSAIACKSSMDVASGGVITTSAAKTTAAAVTEVPVGDYDYSLAIDGSDSYDISDLLYGLFLEDINFAADGGLYAEKIKNRSFEYGSMALNGAYNGWMASTGLTFKVINGSKDKSYLNKNNTSYARLTNTSSTPAGIGNEGFLDGLSITKDAVFNFSGYFKAPKGYSGKITLQLKGNDGTVYGETTIEGIKKTWWKYEASLTASATVSTKVKFYVLIDKGSVDLDMISLFPADTYKGRENGLRKDLAQALEELQPKFLRFPGGCVIEGETLDNAYSWKDSIGDGLAFKINGEVTYGDVAARPQGEDLWGNQNAASKYPYYMTYGLGFYEYFLLCEDIGAQPVPILNAGLSCLIQGTRSVGTAADSAEIGTPEFDQYIQDALDLVEFCKGDASTKWGAIRIAMGHKEPFDLTYIGIGNEQWTNEYYNRYAEFKKAFDEAAKENPDLYGGIQLIIANGPNSGDRNGWNKVKLYGADYAGLVDEHYYNLPSWFLQNTKRYDTYDRNSTAVFLGEYAAKSNNAEAALAEAAYMTGLERNGDIVKLASYAPLFGNSTSYQWSPDMIWFKNDSIWKSVNYYVQKIFSTNQSSKVVQSDLQGSSTAALTKLSGKIGVGTWMTSATFDDIKVVDNKTKKVLYSDNFSKDSTKSFDVVAGKWTVKNGKLQQTNTGNPVNSTTGDAAFVGDASWTNYTITMTATKFSGSEGFLIPFAVKDENNYYHWNIGGWTNTVSCLEHISSGSKSGQIAETVKNCKIENGKAYKIKIVVTETKVQCYLNDSLMVNYTIPQVESVYQVSGLDDNGDLIVKIVNVSEQDQDIYVQANNITLSGNTGKLQLLAAESASDINNYQDPEKVSIKESTIDVSNKFIYKAPKYSVSVIRIPTSK